MRRMCWLTLMLVVLFMTIRGSAQTYATEMKSLLSQGHKLDFHKYQILLGPTTNFAIGTMYPLDITQKGFDLAKVGIYGDSSNWWTTISENDKRAALRAIVRPEGGPMELRGLQTKPLNLSKVFPQISAALAADGQKNDSQVQVVLSASSLQTRTIDWLELDDAVYMEHLIRPAIIEHADKRDFAMTTGDLVLNDFEAHVIVPQGSPELKRRIEAVLDAFVHHSPSSFDLRANSDGSYTLAGKLPVVVAVYITRPPTMKWADLGDRRLKPLSTPYLLGEIAKVERSETAVSSQ